MAKRTTFDDALKAEGVSGRLADLARSIYQQESTSGSNTKTSNAGAVGGMQVTPAAFSDVADKGWDINNPEQNLRAGIRYLKQMDKLSGGVPELTAVGYYGGAGAMSKAKAGVAVRDPRNPDAPDTLQYGRAVVARMGGAGSGGTGEARQRVSPLALPDSAVLAQGGLPPELDAIASSPLQLAALQARKIPASVLAAPAESPTEDAITATNPQAAGQWGELAQYLPRAVSPADLEFAVAAAPAVNLNRPAWYRKL